MRLPAFVLAVTLPCLIMPELALAWSERPAPTTADGSARFSDPDEQTQKMTGRDEDGRPTGQGQTRSFNSGNSGWSFSVTPGRSSSNLSETGGPTYGRASDIPFQRR